MKLGRYIAVFLLLNALTLSSINYSHAAQAKGHAPRHGGNAGTHMSINGQQNTNAQWSADPDRGWVRADERHDLHSQGQSTVKGKKTRAKKSNGRKGASY